MKIFMLLLSVWASLAFSATRTPVYSSKGLVASISPLASEVGAEVLRKGGTAADAAVAVAFALSVTWPSAGNIGGGGFALVHPITGPDSFIDYRETAPAAAGPDFYLDEKGELKGDESKIGYRAAGIPGTVAGLVLLHKKWGKLPWASLVEPARKLAAEGFIVDAGLSESLTRSAAHLSAYPETAKIFLNKGKAWQRGDRLVQKDLATTLTAIQKRGADGFYKGQVANLLVQDMKKKQGVLSHEDLLNFKAVEREPLHKKWKEFEIVTAPPPSSGGTILLEILGMMQGDKLEAMGSGSAEYLHLLIECTKKAFADRSVWFGDPAFVQNPIAKLLDPAYLAKRRAEIGDKAAHDISPGELLGEKPDTTHFTVRDSRGMVISNTYTLNGSYGSGVVVKGTGFILNNEMDDFTSKLGESNMFGLQQGKRNQIAPGKRPLSSMSPTFVYQGKDIVLALGAPGGPTIINSVTQTIINRLIFRMDIQGAADAPRFHHQWAPDKIVWEPFGITHDTRKILEAKGHIFADEPRNFGDIEALAYDAENQRWTGASDSRNGGAVVPE
ncbi:MAG: gamma-glutamyltransferase [Oligoflexus sp.]|nr:gamma-glutamyltransferase [Oligoflexus sp.]